jgi:hypothetical protein
MVHLLEVRLDEHGDGGLTARSAVKVESLK